MNTIKSIKTADGEYQIDYNSLANLPEISSIPENYLPHGTIIRVELNGSGDFISLQDAINFLNNKFSDGTVTIQLGEGTHEVAKEIMLRGDAFNFSRLVIKGISMDKTIVSCLDSKSGSAAFAIEYCPISITFKDFTVSRAASSINDKRCIRSVGTDNRITLKNMHLTSAMHGLTNSYGSSAYVANVTFSEITGNSLGASGGGRIVVEWGTTLTFKNCNYAAFVSFGGQIFIYECKYSATNVTKITNQAIGTPNNNGWIAGNWTQV